VLITFHSLFSYASYMAPFTSTIILHTIFVDGIIIIMDSKYGVKILLFNHFFFCLVG